MSKGPWPEERAARIPEFKQQIVEAIRGGLWISEICQKIGMSTKTAISWREQDRAFDEEYREAEEAFIDSLEKEAHRRALDGVADVVVHNGKVVMDPRSDVNNPQPLLRRRYSDDLMKFILAGRRREVYGTKVETDNRHTVDLSGARESLAAKLTALAERAGQKPVPGDAD